MAYLLTTLSGEQISPAQLLGEEDEEREAAADRMKQAAKEIDAALAKNRKRRLTDGG